jgi:hypothetical protein
MHRKAEEGGALVLGVDRRQRREAPPGRREPNPPMCAASKANREVAQRVLDDVRVVAEARMRFMIGGMAGPRRRARRADPPDPAPTPGAPRAQHHR